jgi:hypothetical protein
LCSDFIGNIYRVKEYAERKELFFLLIIIFHYRNTASIKALRKALGDVRFTKKIREQIRKSGYKQNPDLFTAATSEAKLTD